MADNDHVVPAHYRFPIEPIDYIMANSLDFARGNVVKYLTRSLNQPSEKALASVEKALMYAAWVLEKDYRQLILHEAEYSGPDKVTQALIQSFIERLKAHLEVVLDETHEPLSPEKINRALGIR